MIIDSHAHIVPETFLEDARRLYRAVGSKDKTLKVFTVAEGGAQHRQRDSLSLGTSCIFDWLREKLRP